MTKQGIKKVSHEPQEKLLAAIARPAPDKGFDSLFDVDPEWKDYWWAMPDFHAEDLSPARQLTMQFLTQADYNAFREMLGLKLLRHQNKTWWPPQDRPRRGEFCWRGVPSPTRYPVYVPSKGRAATATTPALLEQAGIEYKLVVEPTEANEYKIRFGADRVLVLPFHDLLQGSIPARNWIWDHAIYSGAPWHWIIDDNVAGFYRSHMNKRLTVRESSAPLRMVEDFVDRFNNLAFAGLADIAFMGDTTRVPITLNTRIYSVTLINSALDYRWRGRFNEDTDICLRALKDGWATVLFKNMLMDKPETSRGDGKTGSKGGNTDSVYAVNDHRLAFAESLKEQHPDVTEIVWKFNRWHHQVDYSPFRNNELNLKPGITPIGEINDYGLELVRNETETKGEMR